MEMKLKHKSGTNYIWATL